MLTMIWSFAELCNAFSKVLELAHFDPAWPICLETDASGFAIAGIILQQQDNTRDSPDGSTCFQVPFSKGHWHQVAFWS
jgi:hypothetical protein